MDEQDKDILPIDLDELKKDYNLGGYFILKYDTLIRKYELTLEEAAIFSLIKNFCDMGGSCKLSAAEIGKRVGIKSRNTVSKYIGTLLLRGLISLNKYTNSKGIVYELISNL